MTRPNLTELSHRVTAINEANGWMIDLSNRAELGNKIALIASEACEVLDERERPGTPLYEALLAMQVEYADAMIRILHLCDRLSLDAERAYVEAPALGGIDDNLASAVMEQLVRPSFRAFEVLRQPKPLAELAPELRKELGFILRNCEGLASLLRCEENIWQTIDRKLQKNAKRGFRHGGKTF